MRIAHVREAHGPAGAPWRLALAHRAGSTNGSDAADRPGEPPATWLDAEVVRRRLVAADPRRAHNAVLFRQPLTTTDDLVARGVRLGALAELVEGFEAAGGARGADDEAVLEAGDLRFGPPVPLADLPEAAAGNAAALAALTERAHAALGSLLAQELAARESVFL